MSQAIINAHLSNEPGASSQATQLIHFDNLSIPKGSAVAAVSAANAVQSAAAPTKEEFDKVVTLANECKTQLNALIASLKKAGAIA